MYQSFLKSYRLVLTYKLLSEYNLQEILQKIEKEINLPDVKKQITKRTDEKIELFQKIECLIHHKESVLSYKFKLSNITISLDPRMCILEGFHISFDEGFEILEKIIKVLVKEEFVYFSNLYLEDLNEVLFNDAKSLKKYFKQKISRKFDELEFVKIKDIDIYNETKNIVNISCASLNKKTYMLLTFKNKIRIELFPYYKEPKEYTKFFKEIKKIQKSVFKENFKDIKTEDITIYNSFKFLGGVDEVL